MLFPSCFQQSDRASWSLLFLIKWAYGFLLKFKLFWLLLLLMLYLFFSSFSHLFADYIQISRVWLVLTELVFINILFSTFSHYYVYWWCQGSDSETMLNTQILFRFTPFRKLLVTPIRFSCFLAIPPSDLPLVLCRVVIDNNSCEDATVIQVRLVLSLFILSKISLNYMYM